MLRQLPINLLDYFAAHALMGLIASRPQLTASDGARLAYLMAEAMLIEAEEARERRANADIPPEMDDPPDGEREQGF
jgi:hypothetical protein